MYQLDDETLPSWFSYPKSFQRVTEQGLICFDPWSILDVDESQQLMLGLKHRYPGIDVVPFARRYDSDDVFCWMRTKGEAVITIHDFASDGYQFGPVYPSVWDWLRAAIEATIEFEP